MAGSEMGGRLSEDDAGYSMDGRFSCSSLYSEFGHVASHLEERHPGLVLARQVSHMNTWAARRFTMAPCSRRTFLACACWQLGWCML